MILREKLVYHSPFIYHKDVGKLAMWDRVEGKILFDYSIGLGKDIEAKDEDTAIDKVLEKINNNIKERGTIFAY